MMPPGGFLRSLHPDLSVWEGEDVCVAVFRVDFLHTRQGLYANRFFSGRRHEKDTKDNERDTEAYFYFSHMMTFALPWVGTL